MFVTTPAVDLGFILKKISNSNSVEYNFSMNNFDDRLKLQKIIYIIQSFGVYLGYDFSYYLRGPYCSKLAQMGFELTEVYGEVEDKKGRLFRDDKIEHQFKQSVKLIQELRNMDNWEIAASLHLLNHSENLDQKKAVNAVIHKEGTNFSKEQCDKIWKKLEKLKLVMQ
ncbi:MAG: hypothetical protein K8823_969 [Cenarchaeum symbiont of Oopsacas minuta]|nr:hypothetical protein [Cenarchaeum symbiont of Oopsacas minuta]